MSFSPDPALSTAFTSIRQEEVKVMLVNVGFDGFFCSNLAVCWSHENQASFQLKVTLLKSFLLLSLSISSGAIPLVIVLLQWPTNVIQYSNKNVNYFILKK